jgi:hypothetical protein
VPIHEINKSAIRKLDETTFGAAGIKERSDLRRLLREDVEVISPDTAVVTEEGRTPDAGSTCSASTGTPTIRGGSAGTSMPASRS